MIQRIQSLYLFLAAAVATLPFFFPVARFHVANDATYDFFAYGIVETGAAEPVTALYWAQLILFFFLALVPLFTLFCYKKRLLQVRLCLVEFILCAGSLILMWVHIRHFGKTIPGLEITYLLPFVLPLVSLVLTWLALQGIFKDINLLKSYDRIR